MRKWILMCCAAFVATGAWAAKEMSVQVRDGQLRNRASFLGAVTAQVAYGDRVTVNQTQAGWCEVAKADGAKGWIHESALTPKRVVMSSGTTDARSGASGEEVALAGKGFNSDVEREFKAKNGL